MSGMTASLIDCLSEILKRGPDGAPEGCDIAEFMAEHQRKSGQEQRFALLPGLMCFPKSSFPVEKFLHHPLRLAGQEGLSEYADAEVDGFRQRQFFPLPQQRLLCS